MAMMQVPQSVGDIIDRITILIIKSTRLKEANQIGKVLSELCELLSTVCLNKGIPFDWGKNCLQVTELLDTNLHLWDLEKEIRENPSIELIKEIHQFNKRRSELKIEIGSLEVKNYSL